MFRKTLSCLMLFLLVISSLAAAFKIQPESANGQSSSPVHNIDSGLSYDSIQAAIDANETKNGQTIAVDSGTYTERVNVTKSITLKGNAANMPLVDAQGKIPSVRTTIYSSFGSWAFLILANNVTIENFEVINGSYGIVAWGVNSAKIVANFAHNNTNGISLQGWPATPAYYEQAILCQKCLIDSNVLVNNSKGIFLSSADNNTVTNNLITGNQDGIDTMGATTINSLPLINLVANNKIYRNINGIQIIGGTGGSTTPFCLCMNAVGNQIQDSIGTGIFVDSVFDVLQNNYIEGSNEGIHFQSNDGVGGGYGTEAVGNTITNNTVGIGGLIFWGNPPYALNTHIVIFRNNFINNMQQATPLYTNSTWDHMGEGNYWSDYSTKYPNAAENDHSGIWNTPYAIDNNNIDNYPLMYPVPAQSWMSVTCSSNSISAGSSVTCTATLSGSNPTGTVTWSSNSSTGSFSVTTGTLSSGSCTTTYTDDSAGSVTITASYSGDTNNAPSAGSTTLTISLSRFSPAINGFGFDNYGLQPGCRVYSLYEIIEKVKSELPSELQQPAFMVLTSLTGLYAVSHAQGHCYGIAHSSVDYYYSPDSLPPPYTSASEIKNPSDSPTVYQKIEQGHDSQWNIGHLAEIVYYFLIGNNPLGLETQIDEIKMVLDQSAPVCVDMHGWGVDSNGRRFEGFHEVVAYDYSIVGTETWVKFYDSNSWIPGHDRTMKFGPAPGGGLQIIDGEDSKIIWDFVCICTDSASSDPANTRSELFALNANINNLIDLLRSKLSDVWDVLVQFAKDAPQLFLQFLDWLWNNARDLYDKLVGLLSTTLNIVLGSCANLYVTDPVGRHIGIDPNTEQMVNEIPGAAFFTSPEQTASITDPLIGNYDIHIYGTGTGPYNLTVEGVVNGTSTSSTSFLGTALQGVVREWTATIARVIGPLTVNVTPNQVHDVAVTNVTSDRVWVYQGFSTNINVTVLNKGDFDENVSVTLYYNTTANKIIGAQNVTLSAGQNETVAFVWNTTGVPYCYSGYNITAYAGISPEIDSNMTNNVLQSPTKVVVRILGDMNGDGKVDILDAIEFAKYFGLQKGDARWNPAADMNQDGVTNIIEAIIIAEHFGIGSSS